MDVNVQALKKTLDIFTWVHENLFVLIWQFSHLEEFLCTKQGRRNVWGLVLTRDAGTPHFQIHKVDATL